MEKIEVSVMSYYGFQWYFPFMPSAMFEALEKAFLNDEETAVVNRADLEAMLGKFLRVLAN